MKSTLSLIKTLRDVKFFNKTEEPVAKLISESVFFETMTVSLKRN